MRQLLFLIVVTVLSAPCFAYYALHDTGDILQPDNYNGLVNSQIVTSGDVRVNITGHFDLPINTESQVRIFAGTGDSRFHVGGGYKWIPIPDFENQPAIGVAAKAMFAQPSSSSEITLSAAPLISKRIDTSIGANNLYAALPINIQFHEGSTNIPLQLALGSFWKPNNYEFVNFGAEIGFNLSKSFHYLSLVMTVGYDQENGFKFH